MFQLMINNSVEHRFEMLFYLDIYSILLLMIEGKQYHANYIGEDLFLLYFFSLCFLHLWVNTKPIKQRLQFCYAAETAFVSSILLQIGLPVVFISRAWCFPLLIGFWLVPALETLSDKCQTRFGRRRPFTFMYSIGTQVEASRSLTTLCVNLMNDPFLTFSYQPYYDRI